MPSRYIGDANANDVPTLGPGDPVPRRVPKVTLAAVPPGQLLTALLREIGLPAPRAEYLFAKPRRYRFDLAWPEPKIALEWEGGIWSKDPQAKAAHAMPLAILRDMEKNNCAVLAGWRVLRFQPSQITEAAQAVRELFAQPWQPKGG